MRLVIRGEKWEVAQLVSTEVIATVTPDAKKKLGLGVGRGDTRLWAMAPNSVGCVQGWSLSVWG